MLCHAVLRSVLPTGPTLLEDHVLLEKLGQVRGCVGGWAGWWQGERVWLFVGCFHTNRVSVCVLGLQTASPCTRVYVFPHQHPHVCAVANAAAVCLRCLSTCSWTGRRFLSVLCTRAAWWPRATLRWEHNTTLYQCLQCLQLAGTVCGTVATRCCQHWHHNCTQTSCVLNTNTQPLLSKHS